MHASRIMANLNARFGDIEFIGIGGENMIAQGLHSLVDFSEITVMGFWEVIKKVNLFLKLKKEIKHIIENSKIDLFLPVDYPGFNLEIAKIAKKNNVPVVWFIAPQLWAWGKDRAKKLQNNLDELLCVLPFEEAFFQEYSIDAKYVGHPLIESIGYDVIPKTFEEREDRILIMPGSRKQEIKMHLPLILDWAKEFKQNNHKYDLVFALPNHIRQFVTEHYPEIKQYEISYDSRELMQQVKFGIIKSGTANLEATLLGLPFIMFYKTSHFNYFVGIRMVNVGDFSITNILANKKVIPELIQNDFNKKNLNFAVDNLINNLDYYHETQSNFTQIKQILTDKRASYIVSEEVIKYLNKQ